MAQLNYDTIEILNTIAILTDDRSSILHRIDHMITSYNPRTKSGVFSSGRCFKIFPLHDEQDLEKIKGHKFYSAIAHGKIKEELLEQVVALCRCKTVEVLN